MTMFECCRPETLWQDVDAMWQASAAAEWERLNEPDPDEGRKVEAAKVLDRVLAQLVEVEDLIEEAADKVSELPAEDRIGSYVEDIGDMRHEIGTLAEQLRRCAV